MRRVLVMVAMLAGCGADPCGANCLAFTDIVLADGERLDDVVCEGVVAVATTTEDGTIDRVHIVPSGMSPEDAGYAACGGASLSMSVPAGDGFAGAYEARRDIGADDIRQGLRVFGGGLVVDGAFVVIADEGEIDLSVEDERLDATGFIRSNGGAEASFTAHVGLITAE